MTALITARLDGSLWVSTIGVVSLEWEQTIVDARDPSGLGRWWREALGWVVVNDDPDEFEIRPSADRLPGLLFVPVPESTGRPQPGQKRAVAGSGAPHSVQLGATSDALMARLCPGLQSP